MALQGTLKDFGIAEILQLIGHQSKSGVLHLREEGKEVDIAFSEGNVVGAEAPHRKGPELLGERLVRANLLAQADLDAALDLQKRTLRRLGDILLERNYVTREDLARVVQLQLVETIYSVFAWKAGTYQFIAADKVEYDNRFVAPLNVEGVLMEGFRQVDEWPLIRKKIPSDEVTFERGKKVPPAADDDDFGANDRALFAFASTPGRTARDVVQMSLVGDFEGMRTLQRLVDGGYLAVRQPARRDARAKVKVRGVWAARVQRFAIGGAKLLFFLALVGIGFYLVRGAKFDPSMLFREQPIVTATTGRTFVGKGQLERLRRAIELYRLEEGKLPADLNALVEKKIVLADEVRFPWSLPYYYKAGAGDSYELFPPPY
ncbi:MAG: DUF4388 domain-containing protein [Deltaproteobacteria bacterium]|nr:DUF4388 domain-containing protein [Deltaproteobacteria bacterium]